LTNPVASDLIVKVMVVVPFGIADLVQVATPLALVVVQVTEPEVTVPLTVTPLAGTLPLVQAVTNHVAVQLPPARVELPVISQT
jgi:hypothetical protein